MQLSNEQEAALSVALQVQGPVLITGSAGTGKSILLKELVSRFPKEKVAIAAPTGIAAQNVSGVTLHSLFGIPIEGILYGNRFRRKGSEFFQNLDLLVVDEISMVRVDLITMVDNALKFHRKSDEPFGGLKVIFFGDPYQLPPVLRIEDIKTKNDPYGNKFRRIYGNQKHFFKAVVFREHPITILELQEIHRYGGDKSFAEILNRVRKGQQTQADLDLLAHGANQEGFDDHVSRIFGKNDAVDQYNSQRLQKLPAKTARKFKSQWISNPEVSGIPLRISSGPENPADDVIEIRLGARIIFTKNDDQSVTRQWVNGSTGEVVNYLADGRVLVQLDNGDKVFVGNSLFEVRELVEGTTYSGQKAIYSDITGWYYQLPMRLGWAISVHKSQGQTLDRAVLDFDDQYFEPGQAYVALSRVRGLDSLFFISNPKSKDVLALDSEVVKLMKRAHHFPFDVAMEERSRRQKLEEILAFAADCGYGEEQTQAALKNTVASTEMYSSLEKLIAELHVFLASNESRKLRNKIRILIENYGE